MSRLKNYKTTITTDNTKHDVKKYKTAASEPIVKKISNKKKYMNENVGIDKRNNLLLLVVEAIY